MTKYRRLYVPNALYFFTVVTNNRDNIFDDPNARRLLRESINFVKESWPFDIEGFVLLPNHLHTIWRLPENDDNFSTRWRLIKYKFSLRYGKHRKRESSISQSKIKKGERMFWQRRFWEHVIRNEKDFANHLDYIHYNPVKHKYVKKPCDWKWSSFHKYVQSGWYDQNWGDSDTDEIIDKCVGE